MLYYEFLVGTGAPDNILAQVIYTGLNRIYMRHDEYTKEEAYRDGQKILEDLNKVASAKREVKKLIYYHGIGNPFSYSCGYCCGNVDVEDVFCRWCGVDFIGSQGVLEDKANNRQEPDKRKEAEDNEK